MKRTGYTATAALRSLCSVIFICCSVFSVAVTVRPAVGIERTDGTPAESDTTAPDTQSTDVQDADKPSEQLLGGSDGESKIVSADLSAESAFEFSNETKYKFDPQAIIGAGYPIEAQTTDEPSVLILHSHATECYTEPGAEVVTDTRSSDPGKNMVAVGEAAARALRESGVGVIHIETLFDKDDYNSAYENSRKAAEQCLKENPGIRYVIDIHRDALQYENGSMVKTSARLNGEAAAQVMLVVGTNEGGADHPGWKTNLCVALRLQQAMCAADENWVRPVNLRRASFNQQYAPGAFLLEIGTCANTLDEAKTAAREFGRIFAELIKNP